MNITHTANFIPLGYLQIGIKIWQVSYYKLQEKINAEILADYTLSNDST